MDRPPSTPSRRKFLRVAAGTTAVAIPSWFVERSAPRAFASETSPNKRPSIALIGCGPMGTADAKNARRFGNIVAVCDVDKQHLAVAKKTFPAADTHHDFRHVCDRHDVDVIINGTPDHWHTFVNLRALRSGKDVYSEKPLTLTIDEGKRVVAAVRESGRVLQTGSQQRSDATFRLACELVRNGRIGKVERVKVWLPCGRRGGPFAERPVPPELDWDFWQGQTPEHVFVPERCHGNFRYWWTYSGGTMTDWGAHHNDVALWGLGKERTGPVAIEGKALVEPIQGGYTAASEYSVKYTYADGVEHHCRSTSANGPAGAIVGTPKPGEKYHGVQFEGTDGWIFVSRDKVLEASDPALLTTPLPSDAVRLYESNDHMANFFDCVRSRRAPIADAEIGHRSASLCHLGVIAIRLGRKLTWDPEREEFIGDAEANALVAREMREPYTYDMI